MSGRTIAIGDIHGCSAALAVLLDAIGPHTDDRIVTLGDHIDRGSDSRGVIERLLDLSGRCRVIPLMGNHEEMLAEALTDNIALKRWLSSGGADTLRSYGWRPGGPRRAVANWIPKTHRQFLANCLPYFETTTHLFTHAGLMPELPMDQQPALALRWRVTDARTATPHHSGKVTVVGHTPQQSGEVLDLGFLIGIDTNCARGGWLTALDVGTGEFWQVDRAGKLRMGSENTS